ncbi:MAG: hypothetical protein AAFO94_19520 [Bacteroidota bacterium]
MTESALPAGGLTISNTNFWFHELPEPPGPDFEGPATNPTNFIIQQGQALHCHFTFNVSGFLHPLLMANWTCTILLEKMGPGEGPALPTTTINYNATGNYNGTMTIPGSLPVGTYRIVATLTCFHPLTGTPLPLAAFEDGKMVQVYHA